MRKKIFLFDIDGTLTEARKPITKDMIETLNKLSYKGKIGLVTGSGFDYVKEQILNHIDELKFDNLIKNLLILPCNGTKLFIFTEKNWHEDFSMNIKKILSQNTYNTLIKLLLEFQLKFISSFENQPLTGNFISYRESLVNWSPIGRDAKDEERKWFIEFDKKYDFRNKTIVELKSEAIKNNINFFDIKLGGDTSFDIFPIGWDKTFALNHFNDESELFFFGDRCFEGGNDYELFQKINEIKSENAFHVKNYQHTIQLLKNYI